MVEKLIRCTQCNQVVPHLPGFGDFRESSVFPGVEWSPEDLDTQKAFFEGHRDHPLEELRIDPETFISDKPCHEPTKVSYFEASNGERRFLIRRIKNGLERPASYELIRGQLQVSTVSVRIQEEELRQQIAARNGSAPLWAEKAQKFIEAFRQEVSNIKLRDCAEAIEMTQEGDTSLLVYGCLKEPLWEKVLHRCQNDFNDVELLKIKQFILENRQPSDVLALLIKQELSVLPG